MDRRSFLGWVVSGLVSLSGFGLSKKAQPLKLEVKQDRNEYLDCPMFIFRCPQCRRRLAITMTGSHLNALFQSKYGNLIASDDVMRSVSSRALTEKEQTQIQGTCDHCRKEYERMKKDVEERNVVNAKGNFILLKPSELFQIDLQAIVNPFTGKV